VRPLELLSVRPLSHTALHRPVHASVFSLRHSTTAVDYLVILLYVMSTTKVLHSSAPVAIDIPGTDQVQ
jgi:hypothetical protein